MEGDIGIMVCSNVLGKNQKCQTGVIYNKKERATLRKAAPDLLYACESLLRNAEFARGGSMMLENAMEIAEAAVAKAKGI